jgi:hypothetical protein
MFAVAAWMYPHVSSGCSSNETNRAKMCHHATVLGSEYKPGVTS